MQVCFHRRLKREGGARMNESTPPPPPHLTTVLIWRIGEHVFFFLHVFLCACQNFGLVLSSTLSLLLTYGFHLSFVS